MAQPQTFWISTGDIVLQYDTLDVVSAYVSVEAKVFSSIDPKRAVKQAVDEMAQAAQKLGGDGVIWIRFNLIGANPNLGFYLFASGTAIRIKRD